MLKNAFILCVAALLFACVKKQNSSPVPKIEFRDFTNAGISSFTNSDTATMVLGYEDGDGDLFVDRTEQGPNVIFTTYYFDEALNKFTAAIDPITKDTLRYTNTVSQPDNGYYKGKSIKGEIFLPLDQFRPARKYRLLKFSGFMVDVKKNKSNVFTSPTFSLNF